MKKIIILISLFITTTLIADTEIGEIRISQDVPLDYYSIEAEKNKLQWDKMTFEITNDALGEYLGKGTHEIYIVFYIHILKNTNFEILPAKQPILIYLHYWIIIPVIPKSARTKLMCCMISKVQQLFPKQK